MIFFKIFLLSIFSYLIGSISFSYIVTKLLTKQDIRTIGSHNSGATNVMRTIGIVPGIIVLLLDILKGFIIIKFSYIFIKSDILLLIIGLFGILGHSYSIFLNFKGGKSVAISFGIFLAVFPLAMTISLIIFLASMGFFGIVSISSIISALCFPIIMYSLEYSFIYIIIAIFIAIFIVFRHSSNIKRLIKGTEQKILR